MCGACKRVTCVVDGDTVWYLGPKYRFEEIDTPEKGDLTECMQEGLQAIKATRRLAEILTKREFSIVPSGRDRYGRMLAKFIIGETTTGAILVEKVWRGRGEDGRRTGADEGRLVPIIAAPASRLTTRTGDHRRTSGQFADPLRAAIGCANVARC